MRLRLELSQRERELVRASKRPICRVFGHRWRAYWTIRDCERCHAFEDYSYAADLRAAMERDA